MDGVNDVVDDDAVSPKNNWMSKKIYKSIHCVGVGGKWQIEISNKKHNKQDKK